MTLDPTFLEQAPQILSRVRAEAARRSLKEFTRQAWPTIEPGTPLIWGWSMDAITEHLEAVARREIKRLVINVPPGASKALTHDTPILTLDGWKNHGDLAVGDYVYGMDGLPKRVEALSPEMFPECYEVTFDDGASIVASREHEWLVERDVLAGAPKWNRTRERRIVETHQLLSTEECKGDDKKRQDRIPLAEALYGVTRHHLIDPYTLGAWLGDGSSKSGHIYTSEQDLPYMSSFGEVTQMPRQPTHTQGFYRILVPNLGVRLRISGQYEGKHVPEEYLLGSRAQRLALLQGLLDTDGHCTKEGIAGFSNTNENLARAVMHLARSLGCKPTLKKRKAKFNGVEHSDYYQVFFRPPEGMRPFRIPRKNANLKPYAGSNSIRTRHRYVNSVRPVGKCLARCIQVEGGMYLAGEALIPTHNSRMTRVMMPAWVWTHDPYHKFLSASYALDLTIRDNLDARRIVTSQWYHDTFGLSIAEDDGGKTGFSLDTLGSLKAVTVGGKTTGFRGDTFLIDDPINVQDANSAVKRAEALEWFAEAAQNRINNAATSAIVVIMQRVHEDDVAALAMEMGYDSLIIPMRWDEQFRRTTSMGWTDPRAEEGELMFPERFPGDWVDQTEQNLGPYAFAAQYQQTPVPRKGAMFAVDKLNLIDALPEDSYIAVRAWDLAGTAGAGAFTVGLRLKYGRNSRRFFIDHLVRAQLSAGAVRDLILETAEADGVETKIVLPKDPGQAGVAQIEDLTALLAGFNVKAEAQSGSKETRAEPLAAQIENGHISVVQDVWTKALVEEMRFFPKGKFRDQVDAAASAFNALAPLTRAKRRVLSLVVGGERQENFAMMPGAVANR
jgi:predicted phage terminase large subunit-like protein